jgi:hypothetical protein
MTAEEHSPPIFPAELLVTFTMSVMEEPHAKAATLSSPTAHGSTLAHMCTTLQPHPPALRRRPCHSGCHCTTPATASVLEVCTPVAASLTGLELCGSHWVPRPWLADAPSSNFFSMRYKPCHVSSMRCRPATSERYPWVL